MYINEPQLLRANSTNLRHLNCSFLMCWTFFSKVPIMASNLLHVSHFNVDDPKGNRCGTIQTKHHHHSHLIQNSTNTTWHLFINLKLSGWNYQSIFVFHTLGSLPRQHHLLCQRHWSLYFDASLSVAAVGNFCCENGVILHRIEGGTPSNFISIVKRTCSYIQYSTLHCTTIQYTIQYNTIQYNTIQYNTIRCTANLHSVYYPAYKIWYI